MNTIGEIVQLKVRLLGISPMIWRRVLVPSTISLRELHGVLQVAMGWEGVHLFLFDIHAVQYGSFDLHLPSPDIAFHHFGFRKNDKFSYVYDMGGYWEHEVRVEGCADCKPRMDYPVCTSGSGACPPEDCGGPHGFLECRDEADGYDAWVDMSEMVDWLAELQHTEPSGKSVRDILSDDVEATMRRVLSREPFVAAKFSRKIANQSFRQDRHKELMHQQM